MDEPGRLGAAAAGVGAIGAAAGAGGRAALSALPQFEQNLALSGLGRPQTWQSAIASPAPEVAAHSRVSELSRLGKLEAVILSPEVGVRSPQGRLRAR
jgi:hypothetical protein